MEKHLLVTGTSTVSWKDATVKTLEEINKTIDYLSSVTVIKQYGHINGNKISEYYVDLDVAFIIDRDRK